MNAVDRQKYNLNAYLQPLDTPVTSPLPTTGFQFDIQTQAQGRLAIFSNINLKNFSIVSGTASASGTFGNGASLYLSSDLVPQPPHQFDVNFAEPYVAIYQGTTTGAFQIYPTIGGSVTPGQYTIQGGLDYHGFGTYLVQTASVWKGVVTNNSAGNVTLIFATFWKWLQYNASIQR